MKIILLALAAFSISTHGLEISEQIIKHSNTAIAKLISQGFLNRMQNQLIRGIPAPEQESRATLLPPADDPTYLPILELPLNISTVELGIDYTYTSTGHLSYCYPEVTGLSKLVDDFTLGVIGKISAVWNLDIPKLAVKGPYQLNQEIDAEIFGGHHNVTGVGELLLGVDDVFFKLNATGTALVGNLHIDTLEVDLGFKNLTGHATNATVDGKDENIDSIIGLVEQLFGAIWTDTNKVAINEMTRCTLNHLIANCTLSDIVSGKYQCLADTLDPTCFGLRMDSKLFELDFSTKSLGYCDAFVTPEPTTVIPTTVSTNPPSTELPTVPTIPSTESTTLSPKPSPPPAIDIDINIDIDIDINININ